MPAKDLRARLAKQMDELHQGLPARLRADGHDEGLCRHSYQAPTGELAGYIGVTEAKLPKDFHLSNVVTFPRRLLRQRGPAQMRGGSFYLRNPDNRIL